MCMQEFVPHFIRVSDILFNWNEIFRQPTCSFIGNAALQDDIPPSLAKELFILAYCGFECHLFAGQEAARTSVYFAYNLRMHGSGKARHV